jgi:glycerophosphoryl diester phosphodiesterase
VRHPFFSAARPQVFAHRGGAALAPENTIAAFDRGLALGADGLELDVRLSRDGVVVVHHDPTLERTTRLTGRVDDVTADVLAHADVPALATVLARYPATPIIIELKVDIEDFVQAVLRDVHTAGADRRVCLGAFGVSVLRRVRALAPAIATSAGREEVRWDLYRSWCGWPLSAVPYDGYQVPERAGLTRVVSRRFVDRAHRAGLGVQVWTVNDVEDAGRLLEWGVDALITDRPDRIVPFVRQYTEARPGLDGSVHSSVTGT